MHAAFLIYIGCVFLYMSGYAQNVLTLSLHPCYLQGVPYDLFYINSYSYAEAFAEKLRATVERSLPRDLYDVVEIYRREHLRPSSSEVLKVLTKKCEFKGVELPN